MKHIQNDIPHPTKYNPAISPLLEECLLTALQRNPEKRYATVADFVSELKIAQGFTTSIYKPAQPDFGAVQKTAAAAVVQRKETFREKESHFAYFMTHLPQKYIWIAMVVLFLAAFTWAFFSFGNFWSTKTISVPGVVGMTLEKAEKDLKNENLRISVDEIASDKVPVGQVISQTPQPGSSVKEQRIIHLTVSKGGTVLLVPDLKGMTLSEAKERIERLGLTLGAVEKGVDKDASSDAVISQTPSAGSNAEKGTIVNLVINEHRERIPNLIGMTLADAKKTLAASGITLGELSSKDKKLKMTDDTVVADQTPLAGNIAENGQKVDLVLAKAEKNTKTEEKKNISSGEKRGTINISIPKEGKSRKVEIIVIDDNGKHMAYSGQAEPGTAISQEVSGIGTVRVQILVDDSVVQDREL